MRREIEMKKLLLGVCLLLAPLHAAAAE